MNKTIAVLICLLFTTPASADISKDLHEFYKQVTDSNITPAGAYKGTRRRLLYRRQCFCA